MPSLSKYLVRFFAILLLMLVIVGCRKENFVEPVDPFETQRLDPDPEILTLGSGSNAISLKTNRENITETDNGIRIKGSVFIANSEFGDIRLTNGDFELLGSGNSYSGFNGFGLAELPHEGIFQDLLLDGMPATMIGFQKGSEFDTEAFSWPLNDDRYYFYYEYEDGYEANIGEMSMNGIKRVAIDPTDPMFYLWCDFSEGGLGPLQNVGMGFSAQGLLRYRPLVDYYNIPEFNGNLYFNAAISLEEIPVAIEGEVVLAFRTPETDAFAFFNGENGSYKFGANAQLTLDNEALDFLNIEVVLGQASVYYDINTQQESVIKWAGIREQPSSTPSDFVYDIVGQDWDFLDYLQFTEAKSIFYGTISSDLENWEFGFKNNWWMKIGGYQIDMGSCYLEFSTDHLFFGGSMPLAGFGRAAVDGSIYRNGNFEFKGTVSHGFEASAKGLSIGYSLKIDITFKNDDGTVSLKGKAKLKGKACLGKLCAKFSISASVSISSDGSFEVCFSIGVGKIGYEVCLNFDSANLNGEESYKQTMHATEIPLEQVPLENRFPAENCESIDY